LGKQQTLWPKKSRYVRKHSKTSLTRFKKLAERLGLESVEELERQIDSLEGIDEDGGPINDNLAREARVRAAYMEWCRQYDKQQDEARFQIFSKNFLTMEEFAKKADKSMNLNAYADCTKEEYEQVEANAKAKERELAAEITKAEQAREAAYEAQRLQEAAEVKKQQDDARAARELLLAEKRKAEQEALEERQRQAQELAKIRLEREEERRKLNEKDKADRQKEQEKLAAKEAAKTEAAAIAAMKAAQQAEASRIAYRQKIERQAADLAREKARKADAKLEVVRSRSVSVEPKRKVATPRVKALSKPLAKRAVTKENTGVNPFAAFFSTSPEKPKRKAASTTGPKNTPKKSQVFAAKKTPSKPTRPMSSGTPKPTLPTNPISLFQFGPKPKKTPSQNTVEDGGKKDSQFTLFGSSDAKKASNKPISKVPNRPGIINILGDKPKPKGPAKKSGTINLFGPSKKTKELPAPKTVARSRTINLFGGKSSPAPAPKPPAKKGTLSIFGAVGKSPAPPSTPKTSKSVSLFGAGKKSSASAPPRNMPVLSRWTQNKDGSITGFVSNSVNFRRNEKITTSPIKGVVKAGSVVKTSSGSKYFLK